MERIHYIRRNSIPALIEEYMRAGDLRRRFWATEPGCPPMVELDLSELPKATPKIAGKEVKWDKDTEHYRVTKSPRGRPRRDTVKRLSDTALAVYSP